jgi:hypothetical protein
MRTLHLLAYDDFIEGTDPVYTSSEFSGPLAMCDKLKLIAVVDSVTGGTSITVQLEESGDERNWVDKAGTAEIDAEAISTTAVTVAAGTDDGSTPASGFLRARISLAGTTPKAQVKLWITGRGEEYGAAAQMDDMMAVPTGNA